MLRCVTGIPAASGCRHRGGHARHDLDGNPGSRQHEHLFRAPAKHEGVSAFQADDSFALASRADHEPIDRVLLYARATGALSDAETLRARQTAE